MYCKVGFNQPLYSKTMRDEYIWLYFTVIFKAVRFKSSLTWLLHYLCFKFSSLVQQRKWKKIAGRFIGTAFKAVDKRCHIRQTNTCDTKNKYLIELNSFWVVQYINPEFLNPTYHIF